MDYLYNGNDAFSADAYSAQDQNDHPSKRSDYAKTTDNLAPYQNLVLRSLPRSTANALDKDFRRIRTSKDEFLFHQDDRLQYVYFPETAVVSEFHLLDDGRMVEVSITGREGVIGIATLYHSDRTSNCVQVTQPGTLLRIESELVIKAMRRDPELASHLHLPLENYIRQISLKSVCNVYHSIEERFCTWLLLVQDRCGQAKLKLTHEQIARALGVYRPSVTNIAIDLRNKNLIQYSRGGIMITDRPGMERWACDCYGELCF